MSVDVQFYVQESRAPASSRSKATSNLVPMNGNEACRIRRILLDARQVARHLRRAKEVPQRAGARGQRNAVKNQAFVFRGDFSTAAGQFSHFVYGRS